MRLAFQRVSFACEENAANLSLEMRLILGCGLPD